MKSQKLILVSGLPGVGKSTLAEGIAKHLGCPIFSVDPIESAIIQSGLKRSFETGLSAYLVAQTLAEEHLKLGFSVVIDAVNAVVEARGMWSELEKKYAAAQIIIECILDEREHKKRIEARVRNLHGLSEVTWQEVEERRQEFAPWERDRLIIDTAEPNENNLKTALEYIERTS